MTLIDMPINLDRINALKLNTLCMQKFCNVLVVKLSNINQVSLSRNLSFLINVKWGANPPIFFIK
jgi:hypothetical protein